MKFQPEQRNTNKNATLKFYSIHSHILKIVSVFFPFIHSFCAFFFVNIFVFSFASQSAPSLYGFYIHNEAIMLTHCLWKTDKTLIKMVKKRKKIERNETQTNHQTNKFNEKRIHKNEKKWK